eukprot:CFRG3766T1
MPSVEKTAASTVSNNTIVELYQWHPEWTLSSLDPHCVVARLALAICGVPFKVINCDSPQMSPNNVLPFLRSEEDLYAGNDTLKYAMENAVAEIAVLTPEQEIDYRSVMELVECAIVPAIMYMIWCDEENYGAVTKPAYAKSFSWPLSLYLPNKMRKRMTHNVLDMVGDVPLNEILAVADEACRTIADYLEDQKYLFGDKPHVLDAVVYGHLSFVLNCPMRNEGLRRAVLSRSTLTRYLRSSLLNR